MIDAGESFAHSETTNAEKTLVPKIIKFLEDVRSTKRNEDTPIDKRAPKVKRNIPPITGSGMVVTIAPNLPMIERIIAKTPPQTRTLRLATWKHIIKLV